MKRIRLTYALSTGPAIQLDGIWHSTWDAMETAYAMGARAASAKVLP